MISFLYAAMRSVDLGLRTALIVTPVSVLHNWRQEFTKWEPSEMKPLRVAMLEDGPRFLIFLLVMRPVLFFFVFNSSCMIVQVC